MASTDRKLLVVQVAALGYDLLAQNGFREWRGLTFRPLETVFPAVTCSVQASFRTASHPSAHGMVSNGIFFNTLMRPFFWEQSAALVDGPRIWDSFRKKGKRVGILFWQQSLGEHVDCLISPAPIHKHSGGMIQSCYSTPSDLYDRLCQAVGRSFNLMHYWGPLASAKSSDWIASATSALLTTKDLAPDLCFTYLPVLDYDLQRYGPGSPQARTALEALFQELDQLLNASDENGYEVMIFGDYAMSTVDKGAVCPNAALRKAGLFNVRDVKGRLYPDFYASNAFAMTDHEVAHVYIKSPDILEKTGDVLRNLKGVENVLDKSAQESARVAHPRSGNLVLIAEDGYWFAYPWWTHDRQAPDYAAHVDIHNKPGYDPCELFFGWPPFSVSRDTRKIRGSHGKTSPNRRAAWASTCVLDHEPGSLVDLASTIQDWIEAVP